MSGRLAQREILLAGIAVLGAVLSLAVVSGRSEATRTLPQPVGTWYTALAGERAPGGYGSKTACGQVLTSETEGVSHPVLPCGAKLYLSFDGKRVLTQVIDRGPFVPGREFDLTGQLAATLGLRGVRQIRWAYAAAG